MDLGSESSALESVGEVEVAQENTPLVDDGGIVNNGSFRNEADKLSSAEGVDVNALGADSEKRGDIEQVNLALAPSGAESPGGAASPPVGKGYGLKKWRRIRRDSVSDSPVSLDTSKVLKRGPSGSANPPAKPANFHKFHSKQSEGSVGSTNLPEHLGGGGADGFIIRGSSPDSRFAIGGGTDSENSEDRSSKSSTAASAPKIKYDVPIATGYSRDKHQPKSLASSALRVQQGKVRAESTKKPKGERVKIDKENSHSSMESDSRSSNFVFNMQGAFSGTTNGNRTGRTMNSDGDNSDEDHASEVDRGQASENFPQDYSAADSSWELKEDEIRNHFSSIKQGPLLKSTICDLQSLEDALAKEIQNFGEIGRTVSRIYDASSSDHLGNEETQAQLLSLRSNVKNLENELEDARAKVEEKESRIAELKAALNTSKKPEKESGDAPDSLREMEMEFDHLLQQTVEADITHLVMSESVEKLRTDANQIMLAEEQKIRARELTEVKHKLGEAENKTSAMKKKIDEVEKKVIDVSKTKEGPRKLWKVTSYFLMQLMLVAFAVSILLSQFTIHQEMVVPT